MARRRSSCAVCRRDVAITPAGRFYPHAPDTGPSRCLGSNQTPEAAQTVLTEQNNRALAARSKEATDV